jgi:hypothetical protein
MVPACDNQHSHYVREWKERQKGLTPTALVTFVSHQCGRRQQNNTNLFEENDAKAIVTSD